jgi:hypothetical protein
MKLPFPLLMFLAITMCANAWPTDGVSEEPIHISGILSLREFPGPPNYESVKAGDRSEGAWLLTSTTISPAGKGKTEDYHLVILDDSLFAILKRCLGKRISVDGLVWQAVTSHHRTPYLITVKTITEPNQAPEPTPTAVTPPAGQEARQP